MNRFRRFGRRCSFFGLLPDSSETTHWKYTISVLTLHLKLRTYYCNVYLLYTISVLTLYLQLSYGSLMGMWSTPIMYSAQGGAAMPSNLDKPMTTDSVDYELFEVIPRWLFLRVETSSSTSTIPLFDAEIGSVSKSTRTTSAGRPSEMSTYTIRSGDTTRVASSSSEHGWSGGTLANPVRRWWRQ